MSTFTHTTPTEARTHACPECGSGSTIQIIYGVPDELLRFAAEEGDVILGGWLFADDAPTRYCKGCQAEWRDPDDYVDMLRD